MREFITKQHGRGHNSSFKGLYCGRCANNLRHIYIARFTNSMKQRQMRHFIVRIHVLMKMCLLFLHSSHKAEYGRVAVLFLWFVCFLFHMFVRGHKVPSGTFSYFMCAHYTFTLFVFETHILHVTDARRHCLHFLISQ